MSYKTKQLYEMSVLRHRQQCMILPNNQLISGKKNTFWLKIWYKFLLTAVDHKLHTDFKLLKNVCATNSQ